MQEDFLEVAQQVCPLVSMFCSLPFTRVFSITQVVCRLLSYEKDVQNIVETDVFPFSHPLPPTKMS